MDRLEKVKLAAASMRHAMLEFPGWFERSHPACKEGEQLLQLGRFEQAEQCFLRVLSETAARSTARGFQVKVLLSLATAQWKQKKLAEARGNAESARELLSGRSKPSPELAVCLDLLASIQEGENNPAGARELLRDALEVQKQLTPHDPATLTERYRRLGNLTRELKDVEEARSLLALAVETAEKRLGTGDRLTADCLVDLARCHSACGDHKAGIAALERALEIHRETLGKESEEAARDLQALAGMYHESGDLNGAVGYYEKALALRERQLGGNAAEFGMLLVGLAGAHSLLGRDGSAMELMQQAVAKLEVARDERLAPALESLGAVYINSGRFSDAVACVQRARSLWEKAPGTNEEALRENEALLEEALYYAPPDLVASARAALADRTATRDPAAQLSDRPQPAYAPPGRQRRPVHGPPANSASSMALPAANSGALSAAGVPPASGYAGEPAAANGQAGMYTPACYAPAALAPSGTLWGLPAAVPAGLPAVPAAYPPIPPGNPTPPAFPLPNAGVVPPQPFIAGAGHPAAIDALDSPHSYPGADATQPTATPQPEPAGAAVSQLAAPAAGDGSNPASGTMPVAAQAPPAAQPVASAPTPAEGTSGNVQLRFVTPGGAPVGGTPAPPSQQPLQLTIVMPDGGLPDGGMRANIVAHVRPELVAHAEPAGGAVAQPGPAPRSVDAASDPSAPQPLAAATPDGGISSGSRIAAAESPLPAKKGTNLNGCEDLAFDFLPLG